MCEGTFLFGTTALVFGSKAALRRGVSQGTAQVGFDCVRGLRVGSPW